VAFKSDGAGGFTETDSKTISGTDPRPHRVHYDATTAAFYVLTGNVLGNPQRMLKFTRSGDTLVQAHDIELTFLAGDYSRGFNIIDGKMFIVAEPGKVYEVAFDGTGYTLDATYDLPAGMESPNDV